MNQPVVEFNRPSSIKSSHTLRQGVLESNDVFVVTKTIGLPS